MTLEKEVLAIAIKLYDEKPPWDEFYCTILGVHGEVKEKFPKAEDFYRTKEYQQIQSMLDSLRKEQLKDPKRDDTAVITVRLPKALHEDLRSEAHSHEFSLNQLCLSKLTKPHLERVSC